MLIVTIRYQVQMTQVEDINDANLLRLSVVFRVPAPLAHYQGHQY